MQFLDLFSELKNQFDAALNAFCERRYGEKDPLSCATHYALKGDGKRVRPILCLLAARASQSVTRDLEDVIPAAIALEMIHTYSLVHDDLPSMDNDDLRRGRPTVHKVFGEAEALLAGDSLLTDAFGLLSDPEAYLGYPTKIPAEARVKMIAELAQASGGQGMVLGQSQDLYWTGRAGANAHHLTSIHLRKTGRLLGAAAALGALSQEASPIQVNAFRTFGEQLGLAFQITDDLLDDSVTTGKSQGKDKATGKLTYLSYMGRDEASKEASFATARALGALANGTKEAVDLEAFAHLLLNRQS